MKTPLRSWKVSVKEIQHTYVEADMVSSEHSYQKIRTYYVVARSYDSATYQAKRMAGWPHLEARNKKGVRGCEMLEVLDVYRS